MNDTTQVLALDGTYNKLGKKTFWLFFSERINTAAGSLVLALILTVFRFNGVSEQAHGILGFLGSLCFIVFFLSLAYAFVSSSLVYKSIQFALAPDALKIKKGIFTKQEIAIPYRQIQNVDIERTLPQQFMGLSKLIILTAGHEDSAAEKGEAEGVLPALDKDLATSLQTELLKRADVQKVIQTKL